MALTDFQSKAGIYLNSPPPNFQGALSNVTTEEEQDGFFKSLGKEIIKPAQELGKDIAWLFPEMNAAQESINRLREIDPQMADQLQATIGEKPSTKKVMGDIAGTALTALPLPIGKIGLVAKVGSPFLRAAITGGGYVAAFKAADAMSDNKAVGDIAKEAGVGFLEGAPFGAAAFLGGRGLTRLLSLKGFQSAYNRLAESAPMKIITDAIKPVSTVLSTDFGQAGKDVVDRLINADRNVQLSLGRIMRIGKEVGATFGADDVGREASFQLGKRLRGTGGFMATKPAAQEMEIYASTFRSAEAENLSKEAFGLVSEGKYLEGAQKMTQVVGDELTAPLKKLGLKIKEVNPTFGVFEGGAESSVKVKMYGVMDDAAKAEIAKFGLKSNQDSLLVITRKVGGKLVTGAEAEARPILRIKLDQALDKESVEAFRAGLSQATEGKLGGYLTGNFDKGEIVIANVEKADGLSREAFENLVQSARDFVDANNGRLTKHYGIIDYVEKQDYANRIQTIQRPIAAGAGAGAEKAGVNAPGVERGRITGRVGAGEGRVGSAVQPALGAGELPADLKDLTPEQFYRAWLGDIASEAQSRGVQIRVPAMKGEPAQWVKFEPIENYFPQQVADLNAMKASTGITGKVGRLRKWVIRRAVEEGDFRTADEATKALDGYIEYVGKNGIGVSKSNGWIQYMVKSGQAESEADANRIMRQIFKDQSLVKLGGSLEHARIVNNPFYNPFPDEVVPLYGMDSLTRLENIDQFGVKYAGESAKLPKLSKAIEEVKSAQGNKAADKFDKFLNIAMNRINNATDEAKISYYLRVSQVPKLSFAQIINVGQSILNPLLQTDSKSTFVGLARAFSQPGVQRALESGATIQSVFNEMVNATAAGGNFSDKFLKTTGFIWTEKFNRTVAANAGIEWATRNFEKLLASPEKVLYKSRLAEMGINVEKALARGALTDNELLKAGQIIAEKTQFRSRPLDLPYWASSNFGKVFWQFKNFAYNQLKFAIGDNLIKEVQAKNYGRAARNLLILGTIFPMTGEVLQDVRSLITQSRRPTKAWDRYVSDLAGAGSMGIVMDFLDAARFNRTEEILLSPSIGNIAELWNDADEPDKLMETLFKMTGFGTPIINVFKEPTPGRESTLETIKGVFE